jgi:hypothetical protein
MSEAHAASLRQTLIEIDRQLLAILLPHGALDHAELGKVATLEHARMAAQRLLLAEEADAPQAGA